MRELTTSTRFGFVRGQARMLHCNNSPLCVPRAIDNAKCVIVSEALRDVELMAWGFVMICAR